MQQNEETSKPIFHEIKTVEQAQSFLLEKLEKLEGARALCDVRIPNDPDTTKKMQIKAYYAWNMRYGEIIGALCAFMHCRVLNEEAYRQIQHRILNTARPTIVGVL